MKRIWGHVVSLFVAGAALSAVMPACATNDESIYIDGVLAPSANRTNGRCTYTTDPQQTHLFEGALDVGLSESYTAVILIGNQMIPRGDPQNNRAESNRVHINGAVVRVTEADGTLIREFTSPATGLANPASNNTPGFAVASVIGIDAPTTAMLAPQLPTRGLSKTVLVNMKAFGKSLGGKDLESGEYQFPVSVCNGCLVDFSTGDDPQAAVQPNCNKTSDTPTSTTTVPCFGGQDELVKCEACRGLPACDGPLPPPTP